MASIHDNKNEKTIERLIAEIRCCRDWIGVNFLDDHSKDKEDDRQLRTKERVTDEGAGAEEVEIKSVRLLDYACGTGMISRVRLSPLPHKYLSS